MSALKPSTAPIERREGGDPGMVRRSPGQTKHEQITLERCVTHDTEFEQWANTVSVSGSGPGAEVSPKDLRKDTVIEAYNESGQLAIAYRLYRCWVSEYQALPDPDASVGAIVIQTLKLENEGWERDYAVDVGAASRAGHCPPHGYPAGRAARAHRPVAPRAAGVRAGRRAAARRVRSRSRSRTPKRGARSGGDVFPSATPTDRVDSQRLARLSVAGGNIRNIVLHAPFFAAAEEAPVQQGSTFGSTSAELGRLRQ